MTLNDLELLGLYLFEFSRNNGSLHDFADLGGKNGYTNEVRLILSATKL